MGTVEDISLFFLFLSMKNSYLWYCNQWHFAKVIDRKQLSIWVSFSSLYLRFANGDSTGQFLNKQPTITFSPQCRNLIFRNNGFHFFFIHFKLNVFIGNCDETAVILGEQFAKLVLMWNFMWWNYWIESKGHTSDNFFAHKIFINI